MALKQSNKNRKKEKVVIEEPVLMPNVRAVDQHKYYVYVAVAVVVLLLII